MMYHNDDLLADTLNELVRINYDRMYAYEKAAGETEKRHKELKALFRRFADMSRGYITHWQKAIRTMGQEPSVDPSAHGKIYHIWMDFKSSLVDNSQEAILNASAFGEKAAIIAYESALLSSSHLPDGHREEMARQKANIQGAQKSIVLYAEAHDILS